MTDSEINTMPLRINLKNFSNFTKLELNEIMDKNEMFKIINCEELKKLKDYDILTSKLTKMMKKVKNNKLRVKYARKINAGRFYGWSGHTFQMLNGLIRNSLAYKKYIDIDMINSHPVILNEICIKHDIPHEKLNEYVINRDEIINKIMTTYNKTQRAVKNMFITMINCGSYLTYTNNQQDDYLDDLTKELKLITAMVVSPNEKLSKDIEKQYKKINKTFEKNKSTLSYFLQDYENIILEVVFKFLKDNDVIKNDNVATLCYDGIMVLKNEKVNDDFLRTMEAEIKQQTGFNTSFKVKDMDKRLINFDEVEDVELDETKLKSLDVKYMSLLPNYAVKKKYFEKFYIMVRLPKPHYVAIYYKPDKNGVLRECFEFNDDKDVKMVLRPVKSGIIDEQGHEISFFKYWTEDPNQNCKERLEFLPYNPTEEAVINNDIYNLFTGFNEEVLTDYDKSNQDKILKPYFDLIYELCGAKKEYSDYYLKVMANIIQNPRNKCGICIEIRGKQGVGKNVSLRPMKNIIGEDHYISSSDPLTFFDTHSIGYLRKLLVNLDEVEIQNNFKYESKIKTAITEDKMDFNPKNQKPFQTNNHSTTVSFTNKKNGLKIDFSSGDRRFVIYKSTNIYKKKPQAFWSNLIKYFDNPKFIACLYDYYMDMDLTTVDWINDRPITEEYKKSLKQFVPAETLYIIKCLENLDNDETYNGEETTTYNIENFYKQYIEYGKEFNLINDKFKPNIKKFLREILDIFEDALNVDEESKKITLNVNLARENLIYNKIINCETDEYKRIMEKLNKEVVMEEDDYFII